MANNIKNKLTAVGEKDLVENFFKEIRGEKEDQFIDFNKIIKMPESLDITCGTQTDRAHDYFMGRISEEEAKEYVNNKYSNIKTLEALYKLGRQVQSNIDLYGAKTWYEWCVKHWGTKWNAYSQEKFEDDGEDTIYFETAWCGVMGLMAELSKQYPEIEFGYSFADEDFGYNVGSYVIKNGQLPFIHEPVGGTLEAQEIYFDVWRDGPESGYYVFNEALGKYEYNEEY